MSSAAINEVYLSLTSGFSMPNFISVLHFNGNMIIQLMVMMLKVRKLLSLLFLFPSFFFLFPFDLVHKQLVLFSFLQQSLFFVVLFLRFYQLRDEVSILVKKEGYIIIGKHLYLLAHSKAIIDFEVEFPF